MVTEDEVEPFNDNNIVGGEKKQGKYRHIRIEGTPYNDEVVTAVPLKTSGKLG